MVKKVLLIEDNATIAKLFSTNLRKRGFEVTTVAGATELPTNGVMIGVDSAGVLQVVRLADFSIAFVDANLQGDYDGKDLLPLLVAAGIFCIGISDSATHNSVLKDNGALVTCPKVQVISSMTELLQEAMTSSHEPGKHEDGS